MARADFSDQKDGGLSLKVKQSPSISWKSDHMLLTEPAVLQEMILKIQYIGMSFALLLLATELSSKGDNAVQR